MFAFGKEMHPEFPLNSSQLFFLAARTDIVLTQPLKHKYLSQ
jgi:hypothetical protein